MNIFSFTVILFLLSSTSYANVFEDRAKEFCDKGEGDICTDLGRYYRDGNSQYLIQKDLAKALELFTKGCDLGSSEGCSELGLMYDAGQGVKKDSTKAFGLYQKTCEGEMGAGCYKLGFKYYKGEGVAKNEVNALKYLTKSCTLKFKEGCQASVQLKSGKLK